MAQKMTITAASENPTATVQALVTLTVAPKEGQVPGDAAAEMLELFADYLTQRSGTFLTDYGTTQEDLQKYHASNGDPAAQPTWGGWEGPFVLESKVEAFA